MPVGFTVTNDSLFLLLPTSGITMSFYGMFAAAPQPLRRHLVHFDEYSETFSYTFCFCSCPFNRKPIASAFRLAGAATYGLRC